MDISSCLFSLLCLSTVWAELQLTVVSPKTAIVGSDTLLQCTFTVGTSHVDLQYLAITWRFKGRELLRYKDRLYVFDSWVSINEAKITAGNASLRLSELRLSHEGEYTCSVFYKLDRIEKTITLILQAHPRIIIQEPILIKGKENLLRCSVVGFYPMEISVFWAKDGQLLPGSSMSQRQIYANGTFMVNCTLPIIPTDSEVNHKFSCHVYHSSLVGPLEKDVMLVLQEEKTVSVTVVVLPLLGIVVIVAVLGWFLYRRLAHRESILCEIQRPEAWITGETAELVCVGHYWPKDIKITWIKLHKGKETEIEARTSPTQDDMQPLLSRNRYRAESRKAGEGGGSLTFTSTLFITPNLEEDEGAVFKCRFFTSDHNIKEEKEFKDFKLYGKAQVCGNITCFPCDGINVQCALDLMQFYPKEIQIKWSCGSGKLEVVPSEERKTENADRRTFDVRTECIVPEEAFNDVNFRIRVTWEYASLKAPEYREMSVTDPDFPGCPWLDDIVVPPLLHGFEASLQCRVAEYFPKELQVDWLKVEKASNGHFPQYDGGNENVLQSDGGYEPFPPSDGINVPNFEVDGTDVLCPSSDESDDDVSQTNESKRLVPQPDGSDELVSQSTGNDGHHPQFDGCDERVNQTNISDGHVPQSDGSVTLSNGINGSVPQCDGSDVPVPPSDACLSVDLLSNDLSCGKQECINITHEPGKGYSCTARLTFTPDLRRHQGSEFICRVSHPSLKETLEKSTGKLRVLSEPKVNALKIESFRKKEVRSLLLDVYGFYPGKVTVLWTYDTQGERTDLLSALNVTEEGDGTYSAQSTCQLTRKDRQKFGETPTVTLTIKHEALREPLTATIRLKDRGTVWTAVSQNFSWAPKNPLPSTVGNSLALQPAGCKVPAGYKVPAASDFQSMLYYIYFLAWLQKLQ